MQQLINILRECGQETSILRDPQGGRVLILVHGGRVLGLCPPGSDQNFLWTNPALNQTESARTFFASMDWHNSGGDRTWLAPEVDVFFPAFPDFSQYHQPRQLDPGRFQIATEGAQARLTNRMNLRLSRPGTEVGLELTKTVSPTPNPLCSRGWPDVRRLKYAGYRLQTTLEVIIPSPQNAWIGLWNLAQLPYPGTLLVPTHSKAQPRIVFGSIPPVDLAVDDKRVRYRMRQTGAQKISLRAEALTGRIAYQFEDGSQCSLVIRQFRVNPLGEYVDVPWDDLGDLGYAAQACCVSAALGEFNEIEHHSPAVDATIRGARSEDTSQVWAFRGSKADIQELTAHLVGPGTLLR